jgi:hypothetical protein
MRDPHLIPRPIARRWALARQGFRYDVASGCWRKGLVALGDEAIDDADEGLWALLMGEGDPNACEEGDGGTVAQLSRGTAYCRR